MYDELVKRLCCCADNDDCSKCHFETECPGYDMIIAESADAIEELQTYADLYKDMAEENQRVARKVIDNYPKWIPVTERLPEDGEYVLCFCRANIACVLRRDKGGDWYENPAHVYMSGFVTHWMPLPEPPEKDSES